jgi:hypothetical protein
VTSGDSRSGTSDDTNPGKKGCQSQLSRSEKWYIDRRRIDVETRQRVDFVDEIREIDISHWAVAAGKDLFAVYEDDVYHHERRTAFLSWYHPL